MIPASSIRRIRSATAGYQSLWYALSTAALFDLVMAPRVRRVLPASRAHQDAA